MERESRLPPVLSAAASAPPIPLVVLSIHATAKVDRADFDPLLDPRLTDRENRIQPPFVLCPGAGLLSTRPAWAGRAAFEGPDCDNH